MGALERSGGSVDGGGFHGHIRAGPDGDTDLRAGQSGGVVDTVADHGHAQATLPVGVEMMGKTDQDKTV